MNISNFFNNFWGLAVQFLPQILSKLGNRAGACILSILAVIGIPSIPIGIDWLRNSHLDNKTILLTATILSATFLFSTRHRLMIAAYGLLLLATLGCALVNGKGAAKGVDHAGTLFLAVALLHGVQRFWWHLVEDRPFPEWGEPESKPRAGEQQ